MLVLLMVDKKKQPDNNYEDVDYEDDLNSTFNQAQKEQDQNSQWIMLLAVLGATSLISQGLTTESKQVIESAVKQSTPTEELEQSTRTAEEFTKSTGIKVDINITTYTVNPDEVPYYKTLMEEFRQHGRVEDPLTTENLTFRNAQNISEMTGIYGANEATKQGNISIYKEFQGQIKIPWTCTGDNPCQDCLDLEADGPYDPENYPEAPHYNCQCNDPMADPILVYPDLFSDEK